MYVHEQVAEIEFSSDSECLRTVLEDYIDQEAKSQAQICSSSSVRIEVKLLFRCAHILNFKNNFSGGFCGGA